jgi:flavin reductase (DIM6/NTAB) family NADH-FMN oxidoreductase RutF
MATAGDPKEFRQVMGLFATGVTVVTAQTPDRMHGMTANAVMSVSLDPLLVCVSVDRRARMNAFLEEARGFVINILAEDQERLARYFAGRRQDPPPYEVEPWVGGPRLRGCLAAVACTMEEIAPGGDHRLFLGRVRALYRRESRLSPLLFFAGHYHHLPRPEDDVRDPVEVWRPEDVQIYYGD